MSRVVGIVIGALTIVLGIYCLFTPVETYGVVSWFIAFAMIADGISKIMLWNDYRKLGESDTWALVGGILSIVLGIVLASSLFARVAVDVFIAYFVSCWLLFAGCVRIGRSFKMRKIRRTIDSQVLGANWGLAFVAGVAMVVLGILCVFNPIIVVVALGWQIGIALIVGGVGLLTATV